MIITNLNDVGKCRHYGTVALQANSKVLYVFLLTIEVKRKEGHLCYRNDPGENSYTVRSSFKAEFEAESIHLNHV